MSNDNVTKNFVTLEFYKRVQGHIPTKDGPKPWVHVSRALGILLINDVLRVAGLGSSGYDELLLIVPLNDVFLVGSVDQEKITFKDIELFYRFWQTDSAWGPIAWATRRRGKMYITPHYLNLLTSAGWDVMHLEDGCDEDIIEAFDNQSYCVSGELNGYNNIPFYCPPKVADSNVGVKTT